MKFAFGQYILDCTTRELLHNSVPIKIEPQVFSLLELLLSHPDRVVTKDDINTYVWNGRAVSDAAVNSRIRSARMAIGDDGRSQKLIKTVHNVGFRFIGQVERHDTAEAQPSSAPPLAADTAPTSRSRMSRSAPVAAALIIASIICLAAYLWSNNQRPSASAPLQSSTRDASTAKSSIAVLPFVDMSENADQSYLGDGLAEEVLNILANVDNLKVASRTSAFMFRNTETPIKNIGQVLNVTHVLEGSVRKDGDDIRVTAQLIDAVTDTHLWSETFMASVTAEGLFKTQDVIARNIVLQLDKHLQFNQTSPRSFTHSTQAYDAYLKAQALHHHRTGKTLDEALRQYSTAIDLDPHFALAFAGRAVIHSLRQEYMNEPSADVIARMRNDIGAASSLAPDLPEVLIAAATLADFERRYEDVLTITQKNIAAHPNHSPSFELRGETLLKLDRLKEAETVLEQGLTLDPLSPYMLNALADVKLRLNDLKGAVKTAQSNYLWNPGNARAMDMIAYLELNKGNYVAAHKIYKNALSVNPQDSFSRDILILLYAQLGMEEAAIQTANTPSLKAFALAMVDKQEAAADIIQSLDTFEDEETLFQIGDFEGARRLMDRQVSDENMLSDTAISFGSGDLYAEACYLYQALDDRKSKKICEKLDNFFTDTRPEDFLRVTDIVGGAMWHMIRNNPDEAMRWLKYLAKNETVMMFMSANPTLKPLEQHPDYPEIYGIMKRNAKVQTELIAKDM